ncbi:MAG: hypothetical protein WCG84_03305 [Candidatus Moraniibacteriota bacterium]
MKAFFPRYSILIGVISLVVMAFLTLSWFQISVTKMQVLLIPGDAHSTALATQVVETLSEDIKTTSFYDQLVQKYPEQQTAWNQMTMGEKRAWWTGQVTTERIKNSGIVNVTLTGSTVASSQDLANQIVTVLRTEPQRLYGASASVGVVVLESPYSEIQLNQPFVWFIATICLGFLLTIILLAMIRTIQTILIRKEKPFKQLTPNFVKFVAMPVQQTVQKFEDVLQKPLDPFRVAKEAPTEKPIETPVAPVVEKPLPVNVVAKNIPGNLPFVENFSWEQALPGLYVNSEASPVQPEKNETQNLPSLPETTPAPAEPTEEELKRRLNQLLRGEM